MMMVAIAATMCVGFTACSEDKEPEFVDTGISLQGKWELTEHGSTNVLSSLEFRKDGTYVYIGTDKSFEGNYQIFEIQKLTGVNLSYIYNGHELEVEFNGTLYKMNVSGSSDFYQWWVYYLPTGQCIFVDSYSNNEFIQHFDAFSKIYD